MSAPSNASRRSTDKSTSGGDGEIRASERNDLPTIEERVQEFKDLYPAKAETVVLHESAEDPRDPVKLRREAAKHYRTEHGGTITEGEFYPVTWARVLREHLEWFDEVRDIRGKFGDGEDEFEVEFLNSYHPDYLEKYYAKLMGLHREIEREYGNPHTAMLSLTSSGTYQDDRQRGPVDHQRERREAWEPTYKRLYDRMESLVDRGQINDWMYVVVEEHHPGEGLGLNGGYGHDHVIVIADGELRDVDFWDVVDTWVEECPGAEHDAHDYRHPNEEKRPTKVRRVDSSDAGSPDVINSAGGYLTKYLYPDDGERDPLERDIEQLAHHAIKWATNTRRIRKSDRAGAAISADKCRQAYADDDRDQDHDHGEKLKHREKGRGPEIVCSECGSAWGIDESAETVVEARRESSGDIDVDGESQDRLRFRWGDATGGALVDSEDELDSFSRPAPIQLQAYVVDGEEYPANGGGGGVDMVPVRGLDAVPAHTPMRQLQDHAKPPPEERSQKEVVEAVLDELQEARDARSISSIVDARGLDQERVEGTVERLAGQGRVYDTGAGYRIT